MAEWFLALAKADLALNRVHARVEELGTTVVKALGHKARKHTFGPLASQVLYHGQNYCRWLVDTRRIPQGKIKKFERAVSPYLRARRQPNKPYEWLVKALKDAPLLKEALSWPDLEEAGDESSFTVGSFSVFNQKGAPPQKLVGFKKVLEKSEKKMRASGIPGIRSVIYGDVYIVGRISQSNTLAWYWSDKDKVYVRLKALGKSIDLAHSFVHELGHRYWRKVANATVKGRWETHHRRIGYSTRYDPREVKLPEAGDVLPFKIDGFGRSYPMVHAIKPDGSFELTAEKGAKRGKIVAVPRSWMVKTYHSVAKRTTARAAYPTSYAATSPEEHFCESFSMYIRGTLSQEHVTPFEDILGITKSADPEDKLDAEVDQIEVEEVTKKVFGVKPTVSNRKLNERYKVMIKGLRKAWKAANQKGDQKDAEFASEAAEHINKSGRIRRGHAPKIQALLEKHNVL